MTKYKTKYVNGFRMGKHDRIIYKVNGENTYVNPTPNKGEVNESTVWPLRKHAKFQKQGDILNAYMA